MAELKLVITFMPWWLKVANFGILGMLVAYLLLKALPSKMIYKVSEYV